MASLPQAHGSHREHRDPKLTQSSFSFSSAFICGKVSFPLCALCASVVISSAIRNVFQPQKWYTAVLAIEP